MFDCGKPEHAAQFDRAKKAIINYVRMTVRNETTRIADALETMTARTILQPPRPPHVLQEPVVHPVIMIEDEAEIIMWQRDLKTLLGR